QDLVLIALAGRQGNDVDLDAVVPGDAGLLQDVSQVLVAVGDQDNALAGPLGEAGDGQLEGGGDVGVVAVDIGAEFIEDAVAPAVRRGGFPGEGGGVAGGQLEARPAGE